MTPLVLRLTSDYETYRNRTLNLIPSENILSEDVLKVLSSNMAGRYAGRPESYGGTRIFHDIWEQSEKLAKDVYHCRASSVSALSGHVAGFMALDRLCHRGDKIAVLSDRHGGYTGYTERYMPRMLGLKTVYFPYNPASHNIDVEKTLSFLKKERPDVAVLGATVFLFPHPIQAISEIVHHYGGKVLYDGSHVLGLIAGGTFQDPLREGADVVSGSTHKTLFGPQGGLILSNDEKLIGEMENNFLYRIMDNIHLNRIAALGVALEEMKLHARVYARKVSENAKELASRLHSLGVSVAASSYGYTESHQVLLQVRGAGEVMRDRLEAAGIIADSRVRFGTNEVTRRGMGSEEMNDIASLVKTALSGKNSVQVRRRVFELTGRYRQICYTLR